MFRKLQFKMMLLNISIVAVVVVTVISTAYISSRNIMKRRAGELRNKIEMMSREEILGSRRFLLNAGILGGKAIMLVSDENGDLVELEELYEKDGLYLKDIESDEILLSEIRAVSGDNRYVKVDEKIFYTFNVQRNNQTIYFVIDATQERELTNAIFFNTIYIGSGAIILILIAAIFLTKLSLKPVKEAWIKQKQFVSDASHELRTPVTIIKTNMEIVSENDSLTIGEQRKWINNVISEAEHMSLLVNDLLFLSKVDDRKKVKLENVVDVQEVALKIVNKFNLLIREKGLELKVVLATAKVYITEPELSRLISLLIDNAIKFTDNGNIAIRNYLADRHCVIEVSDTGRGIEDSAQTDIFKRFYRVDTDRNRKTGGYGLGLSIAKSIVDRYNGKIEVSSRIGEGSTFRIIFPIAKGSK